MDPLFRTEAVAHATRRLDGAVLLPTPLPVWIVGGCAVAVLALAAWFASSATYARKETVLGWLSPETGMVRAVASRGGVVSELLVSKGDVVERDAPLARIGMLDRSKDDSDAAVLSRTLAAQRDARLETADVAVRRLELDARRLEGRRSSLRRELADVGRQIRLQSYRVSVARRDVGKAVELARRGHLSKSDRDAAAAALVDVQQALSGLRRTAEGLEREMSDIGAQLDAIPEAEAAARAEAEGAVAALDERMARLEMEVEYVVVSPIGGRIDALPARAGEALRPGSPVAVVVPVGEELIAELYVPSRAAGFVAAGQPLRLKYEAFPFQRYGAQDGVVTGVSRTVLSPEETGIPGIRLAEPVFRVRGRLAAQRLDAYGASVPLRAGMLLSADIVVDRRTLLEWLLDPLYAVGRR